MKVHLLKLGQYSAAFLATATMTFSPVAMGKQAEKVTKQSITENIRYYGLNKTQTVDQFWQKIKAEVPGPLYKGLESVVKNNKNVKMPNVSVKEVVGTDGVRVPALTIDQGGKITTVQFFGEKKKWITVNGKAYTEQQINRAVAQADRQQATAANSAKIQQYRKDFARFDGFPRMTPQLWKSMTPEKRAGFIVNMRTMWQGARNVISVSQPPAKSSSKQNSKKTSSAESFYRMIFGHDAEANGQHTGGARGPYDGDCVVAGYIGNYDPDGRRCRVGNATGRDVYQNGDLRFVGAANTACATPSSAGGDGGANFVACNPVIYGYQAGGRPHCVDKDHPEFQIATHFPGPCDRASRLTTDSIMQNIRWSVSGDYTTGLPRGQQILEIEQNQATAEGQEPYQYTREYLQNVLSQRNKLPNGQSLASILSGDTPWSKELDDEMVLIQTQFETEITEAMRLCTSSINPQTISTHERNQIGACDQLHRRWLFTERIIAQYRQRACHSDARYVGIYDSGERGYIASADNSRAAKSNKTVQNTSAVDAQGTNLCQCGQDGPRVNFGAPCPGGETPPNNDPPADDAPPAQCTNPDYASIVSSLTADCKCSDGGQDPRRKDDGSYTCDDDGGGFPWLLVGGGLVALGLGLCVFGVICGGKDKDKPPKCRNGQPAPNGDPSQCVFCADNSPAPGGNVANCPVTCPNGTLVTPPATCPTNLCPDGSPRPANGICPDTPPPLCPGTQTPAPGGNVANCPVYCPGTQTPAPNNDASKCPVTCPGGQVVTPPATCPPVCEPGFSGNPCVCTRTCSTGFTLNPSACRCDPNPDPSEGGGGQPQCQNPPCSGGLPGTGN